jgi:hypothetical protein
LESRNLTLEPWRLALELLRLTLEPWRLTLEAMVAQNWSIGYSCWTYLISQEAPSGAKITPVSDLKAPRTLLICEENSSFLFTTPVFFLSLGMS